MTAKKKLKRGVKGRGARNGSDKIRWDITRMGNLLWEEGKKRWGTQWIENGFEGKGTRPANGGPSKLEGTVNVWGRGLSSVVPATVRGRGPRVWGLEKIGMRQPINRDRK